MAPVYEEVTTAKVTVSRLLANEYSEESEVVKCLKRLSKTVDKLLFNLNKLKVEDGILEQEVQHSIRDNASKFRVQSAALTVKLKLETHKETQ